MQVKCKSEKAWEKDGLSKENRKMEMPSLTVTFLNVIMKPSVRRGYACRENAEAFLILR